MFTVLLTIMYGSKSFHAKLFMPSLHHQFQKEYACKLFFKFLPFLSFRIPVEVDNSIDITIDKLLMKTLNGSTPTLREE